MNLFKGITALSYWKDYLKKELPIEIFNKIKFI